MARVHDLKLVGAQLFPFGPRAFHHPEQVEVDNHHLYLRQYNGAWIGGSTLGQR